MLDTKGPEIRTGKLQGGKPIDLVEGQDLEICTDYSIEGDNTRISCSYQKLPDTVKVGDTIYMADGSLTCYVTKINEVRNFPRNWCSYFLELCHR
jgi:pyruvate kinase